VYQCWHPSRGWKTGKQVYRHVLLFSPEASIFILSSFQWEFDGEEGISGVVSEGVRFEPSIKQGHGSQSTPSQHTDEAELVLLFKSLAQTGSLFVDGIYVFFGPNFRTGWASIIIGIAGRHVFCLRIRRRWRDRPSPRENGAATVTDMFRAFPISKPEMGGFPQMIFIPGCFSGIPFAWVDGESLGNRNPVTGLVGREYHWRHRGRRLPSLENASVAGFVRRSGNHSRAVMPQKLVVEVVDG
jgi:hypothetical protein